MLVGPALGTLLSSAVQWEISRRVETKADVDAMKTTGDPVAFAVMQQTLALRSIAAPTPAGVVTVAVGESPDGAGARDNCARRRITTT